MPNAAAKLRLKCAGDACAARAIADTSVSGDAYLRSARSRARSRCRTAGCGATALMAETSRRTNRRLSTTHAALDTVRLLMDDWVFWLIAAVILAAGETATMGFFLAPFAAGALVATALSLAGAGLAICLVA